jgi:hypothetical protein
MRLLKALFRYAHQRQDRYGYHHGHHDDGYGQNTYEAGYRALRSTTSLPAWLSRNGRRLILLLAIGAIILLIGVVGLLLLVIPLVIDAIDFLYRNGINGVLNLLTSIIDKLWKGAGG